MSHNFSSRSSDFDSSGPRPPVPGQEETKKNEMTDSAQSEFHNTMTSSSSSQSSASPPAHELWALSFQHLTQDKEGRDLFERYLENLVDSIHKKRYKFYFLCEGLWIQKDEPSAPVKALVRGIFYRYVKKLKLEVPQDLESYVDKVLQGEDLKLRPELFDPLKLEVLKVINETTYASFLQSTEYVNRLQHHRSAIGNGPAHFIDHPNIATCTSPSFSEDSSLLVSTLPTLLEESDGPQADGSDGAIGGFSETVKRVPTLSSSAPRSKVPMSLTKDALMATQSRRLEMRPPGAHGYNAYIHASYAPVSRRDSELASLSSGRTDSDTMSLSSRSNDGRVYRHHHSQQNPPERRIMRDSLAANNMGRGDFHLNLPFIPRTHRFDPKSTVMTPAELFLALKPKLEAVRKDQNLREMFNKKFPKGEDIKVDKHKLFNDAISARLMADDTDTQDILDQHVSRVWNERTPHRSPGNLSPGANFQRNPKPHENVAIGLGTSTQSSMRASKSMPESNINKFSKWGSVCTDSGISLFSSDTMTTKQKDSMSLSSSASSTSAHGGKPRSKMPPPDCTLSAPLSRMQLEENRSRMLPGPSKRHHQQPPLPQKNVIIPPPLPAKNLSQPAPNVASGATSDTFIVYSYCDEDLPYRIRVPGRNALTLRQFKENMPKKGNYRFFFKTTCDDDENPIIQEEISNDSDVLPLFEGKIMATLKLAN